MRFAPFKLTLANLSGGTEEQIESVSVWLAVTGLPVDIQHFSPHIATARLKKRDEVR